MKLIDLFSCADYILRSERDKNPRRTVGADGIPSTDLGTLYKEFHRFYMWVKPSEDVHTKDIVNVCRCKDCMWFRRYKKKGAVKVQIQYLCRLDMKPKDPEFFCKSGERRV